MNMTIQANDRVAHPTVKPDMSVVGLGDIGGKMFAWCKWIENGQSKQKVFPEDELIKRG
jgi:uncharacterized protein YodC (DUF2158 family)